MSHSFFPERAFSAVRFPSLHRLAALLLLLAVSIPARAADGQPSFAIDLQDVTVEPGCPIIFAARLKGNPPLFLQWFKNDEPVSGATNDAWIAANTAAGEDNGTRVYLVASNSFGVATSTVARVTVVDGVTPPMVTQVVVGQTRDKLTVRFSTVCGGLDSATASDSFNYQIIGPGNLIVLDAVVCPDLSSVRISPDKALEENQPYFVEIINIRDSRGYQMAATNVPFLWPAMTRGLVQAGKDPYGWIPTFGFGNECFDDRTTVRSFESRASLQDGRESGLEGILLPPISGDYTFYLASGGESDLWLAPDDAPNVSAIQLIARRQSGTGRRQWDACASCTNRSWISSPIPLVAGRRYYLRMRSLGPSQADHMAVAWKMPDGPLPVNGRDVLPGTYMGIYTERATGLSIAAEPVDVATVESSPASFTIQASANPASVPVGYQWQRNQEDIPGANAPAYQTSCVGCADDGAQFRCIVSAGGLSVTSRVAHLTVSCGLQGAPILRRVVSVSPRRLLAFFNRPVLPGTAANWTISGGPEVSQVTTNSSNPLVVELTLAAAPAVTPGNLYSITARDLVDGSGQILEPNPSERSFEGQPAVDEVAAKVRVSTLPWGFLIEWPSGWILETSGSPTGPWEDAGAEGDYWIEVTGESCGNIQAAGKRFFRARQ